MKKVLLLGIASLLAGCASLEGISIDFTEKWAGRSYDEFVIENGVAQNSHKLSNGMTMYMWEQEGNVIHYKGNGQSDVVVQHCTLNVLVDTKNTIKSIKASGNPQVCSIRY